MTLTAKALARKSNTTYRQIDYWTNIGIISPIGPNNPGSGNIRNYEENIIKKVRLLGKVSRLFGGFIHIDLLLKIYNNYEKSSVYLGEGLFLSWRVHET